MRATGGSPASRAVPTRGRQLGKMDGPSPARAVEQGGSCHRELHNPGLERAIKCSGARHGIRAIFPSRGRSRTFFFGGGGGRWKGRKKREKGEKNFHSTGSSPFRFLVPRHGQETPRAPRGGFLPRIHRDLLCLSRALSALGQSEPPLWAFACLSAKWIHRSQTSTRGPFQLCLLQAWIYQGQGRGSSGVAEKLSPKPKKRSGFSPRRCHGVGHSAKQGVNAGPLPGTHFSLLRYGYECASDP